MNAVVPAPSAGESSEGLCLVARPWHVLADSQELQRVAATVRELVAPHLEAVSATGGMVPAGCCGWRSPTSSGAVPGAGSP